MGETIPIDEMRREPRAVPVRRLLPGDGEALTPDELLAAWRLDVAEVIEGRIL